MLEQNYWYLALVLRLKKFCKKILQKILQYFYIWCRSHSSTPTENSATHHERSISKQNVVFSFQSCDITIMNKNYENIVLKLYNFFMSNFFDLNKNRIESTIKSIPLTSLVWTHFQCHAIVLYIAVFRIRIQRPAGFRFGIRIQGL